MVRGMTRDEAIPLVEQYLDQAYRAGYDSVAVIHGRGEGILRREVQRLCKRIPYVIDHKLGGPVRVWGRSYASANKQLGFRAALT